MPPKRRHEVGDANAVPVTSLPGDVIEKGVERTKRNKRRREEQDDQASEHPATAVELELAVTPEDKEARTQTEAVTPAP